ncbi:MAG TPA: glycosyltransferase family 2 protein [Sediminibacterium sp.]|nr:glycosyltransferase family 2 protein [Sediminibacterium sp.]
MSQPLVAIVILNYNGLEHLRRFLPAVLAATYANKRVIVADNASTDDSLVMLRLDFPEVEVLTHPVNEGFAGGYNWALQGLEADYYVLLNSDVLVTPGWIEPVIKLMESDKRIAACQPKLVAYRDPEYFEYAGAAGGWLDTLGYPFSRGRVFDICERDLGQYTSTQPVFWASGAAMFVRAAVYHALGGLDASFFAHQEEIDLCWRMQLAGYRVFACPDSVVYHVGAGTLPRGGRKVYLNFRNNLLMLCKNLPFGEKLYKLPLRIGLDALSAWKGLLTGDTAFFSAIFRAHLSVLKKAGTGQITVSKNRRKLNRLEGVYPKSLVWQYFVLQRKTFGEIMKRMRGFL